MMKQMRENTKVILWIVVAAFVVTIFAVWGLDLQGGGAGGQGGPTTLGSVNGVAVTPQMYNSVYNQVARQYRSSGDGNITVSERSLLEQQAWDAIVSNILTDQEIKKLGIGVSDQEVLAYLRSSPPAEVQQYFVDEKGIFDFSAYQAALSNPDADWSGVEALARQRIPVIKLNQYVSAQVHVGTWEVKQQYEEETTKMVARYVAFPFEKEDVTGYTPTDDEIRTYHSANDAKYKVGPQAILDYVKVPITPTELDREDIRYTVAKLRDDILAGEEFETNARTFSEAFTSQVGGDAGFIRRDQRPAAVMAAVDELKPGEISAPIETPDGFFLVKLVEKRGKGDATEFHVLELQLKVKAGPDTVDSLLTLVQDVQRDASGAGGLAAAAQKAGLSVATTPAFLQGLPIEGIGFSPPVSRFAFANEEGKLSGVISDDNAYYVVRVSKRVAETVRPVEEVRDAIAATLALNRQKDLARRKADGFYRTLSTTKTALDAAATQYSYEVANTDTFTVRDQPATGIAAGSAFAYAALSLHGDGASPPVEGATAWYIIALKYRRPFDIADYQSRAQGLRDRLYQSKVQSYVAYWYEHIRKNAKIVDHRDAS